jgi:hypothetical protein
LIKILHKYISIIFTKMFKTDQEFVKRYKKSIIFVPQKVELQQVKQEMKQEMKQEVKQEVKQEMSSWAKKIASSSNGSAGNSDTSISESQISNVGTDGASKCSISGDERLLVGTDGASKCSISGDGSSLVGTDGASKCSISGDERLPISAVKEELKEEVKEKKEQSALELIKAALAQISSALLLLEGIKPYSESSSQILHQATEMTAAVAEITAATVVVEEVTNAVNAIDIQESHNDSLEIVKIVNVEVEPFDFIKKEKPKEDDEFKTVISKKKSKSKNTPASLILPILKKEDDFPSLGSSFSPIKKSGIWGEKGNKSLQIAKLIAHVPSPSPVSPSPSPSPHLNKSGKLCRSGGGGAAVYNTSDDDEYNDGDYTIRKSSDYWE